MIAFAASSIELPHILNRSVLRARVWTSFFDNLLVIDIVDPEKPETWIFQISVSFWSKDPVPGPIESRRLIKEFLSVYCEPFRSVGDWTSDDIPVSSEKVSYPLNSLRMVPL